MDNFVELIVTYLSTHSLSVVRREVFDPYIEARKTSCKSRPALYKNANLQSKTILREILI